MLNSSLDNSDSEDPTVSQISFLNETLRKIGKASKVVKASQMNSIGMIDEEFKKLFALLEKYKTEIHEAVEAKYLEIITDIEKDKQIIYKKLQTVVGDSKLNSDIEPTDIIMKKYDKPVGVPCIKANWSEASNLVVNLFSINEQSALLQHNFANDTPKMIESTRNVRNNNLQSSLCSNLKKQLAENSVSSIKYRKSDWNFSCVDFAALTEELLIIGNNTEKNFKVFELETQVETLSFSSSSERDKEAPYISGIIITNDKFLCTDRANNCLKLFDMDGNLVSQVGRYGRLSGEFVSPEGLCIKDELLYVCDFGNNRVVSIDLDDVLNPKQIFRHTKLPGFVFGPADITTDDENCLVMTEWGKGRALIKSLRGEIFARVAISATNEMTGPSCVQVTNQGKMLIADALQQKIKIFSKNRELEGTITPWYHGGEVHCIKLSPNGKRLCVIDYARGEALILSL